ncbi:MAG: glycosyltransferase family 4 protein [Verrucomicrobiae bacterium]|nr:glycosyltransferase family 4 protein [Verrucomicrobiae bacterium]
MRILSVCTSWRVFGAETVTLRMFEGLRARGHELHAVTSTWSDGEFSRRLTMLGIPETRLPLGAISIRPAWRPMRWTAAALMKLPGAWRGFAQVLRQFQPEAVLYTSTRYTVLLFPWVTRHPSFLVEHTYLPPNRPRRWWYRRLAGRICGFVGVSEFMGQCLRRLGAPAGKVQVIPNGAVFERDREAFEAASAQRLKGAEGPVRVGIVGQIAPHKGHDCLVEAMRLLARRGLRPLVQVFGAGADGYVQALSEQIRRAGLASQWSWPGYEPDLRRIYGSMDICVVPSCFEEPFGMVAAEAGAFGLPVVASRVGGLPEIVEDGVTGWLVEARSPGQLADKIEWLIRHPEQARAMGTAGRERVFARFTVERMTEEFEALFRSCAKGPERATLLTGDQRAETSNG